MRYNWGDLLTLEYGKPVKDKAKSDGQFPVFGTNGQIGTSDLSPLCNHPSFILGRKGAYRGVHFSDIPFSVIDTAFYAENLHPELLDIKWAYYKFLTYDINNMDSGSAIPSTDRYEIYAIPVDLPTLEVQKKVVSVLGLLDKKIELNQRINENLERQVRTIYHKWLADNSGKFELHLLSEIAIINPDTYSPKESWEYFNYLDTSSITNGNISEIQHFTQTEKLPSRARRKVINGDIVFSTVRPNQKHFGMIFSALPNMLVSTGFAVIRSTRKRVCNELIYLQITEDAFIEKMQQLAEQSTSTFPSIKPSDLGDYLISCPSEQDGLELSKQLKAIFTLTAIKREENEKLSALRDTLLPELMAGKIGIP